MGKLKNKKIKKKKSKNKKIKNEKKKKITFDRSVPLHGQMTQSQRLASLNNFKSNERKILIATDVASRGLGKKNKINKIK